MRVISKKRIYEFVEHHSDAEASLLAWHAVAKAADWNDPTDVKKTISSVHMVDGKFVFNIAKNRYRLIAHIPFRGKRLYVLHILTHREYDKGAWKS